MPEWSVQEIRKRAINAIACARAVTIRSVWVELQVGLAYCRLTAITTNASWKMRYQYSARTALRQALRVAARVRLESDGLIYDEFVAAATLLQCALAKLDAEANSPTRKSDRPARRIHTARNAEGKVRTTCLV